MNDLRADDARKFAVVCDGGNVRSAAIAYQLKWVHHQEAIAVGRLHMSDDSMRVFSEWADVIVIVQPHMADSIPESQRGKIRCCDLGPDRWGNPFEQELTTWARSCAEWVLAQ